MTKKERYVVLYTFTNPKKVNRPRWRIFKREGGEILAYSTKELAKSAAIGLKQKWPRLYYRVKKRGELILIKR